MDCCQLEDGVTGVKREDTAGNDPENGSPDADRGGTKHSLIQRGARFAWPGFPRNVRPLRLEAIIVATFDFRGP